MAVKTKVRINQTKAVTTIPAAPYRIILKVLFAVPEFFNSL